MDSSKSIYKRQSFAEEDEGLASIADVEAGISDNRHCPFAARPFHMQRKNNLRNDSSSSSLEPPRSSWTAMRFDGESHGPHFLDSCFLCKKPLAENRDIFMYRGDTPFCSEECRQEQIEMDESKEKGGNLAAASKRTLRNKEQRKSPTSNEGPQECTFRASTVAAA